MTLRDLWQIHILHLAFFRDRKNRRNFGPAAPKFAELLWVDPRRIDYCLTRLPAGVTPRTASALVVDFETAGIAYKPFSETVQFRSCYQHWCGGLPWEDTEDFLNSMRKVTALRLGVSRMTKSMVRKRYLALDKLYAEAKDTRLFKTQKQLKPWNFREFGGIQVSIDAHGTLALVRASGMHRLSIAKILGLELIPAQIGLVDVRAVDHVESLRKPRRPNWIAL